jgi:hypothetical protein
MIQSSQHSTAAAAALVELLESGLPESSALESAFRAIPLRCWRLSIDSRETVATWAVRATVPNPDGEPLQIHLERQKSFVPNDRTIDATERFDGKIIYSTREEAAPVVVPLNDRPRLLEQLLQSVSGALGESESQTSRWQQQVIRAGEYAVRERTAVMWLKDVAMDRGARRPYGEEAARALVAEQLEKMSSDSAERDSFELLEIVGAVRVEKDSCSACVVTARVQQLDSEGNEYPFELGVAVVSGAMATGSTGIHFEHTVIALSDFSRVDLGMLQTLVKRS